MQAPVAGPPSPLPASFDVDAFGCRIRGIADSPQAKRALVRSVFPSLTRTENTPANPDVIVRIEEAEGQFRLLVDDVIIATAPGAAALEPSVVRVLDDAVVRRLRGLHAIHAGVVGWGGKALLFPGSTHSGKSTLVAELVRRGAIYYSDEYALVDADGLVHAYPRPMLLRSGTPDAAGLSIQTPGTIPIPARWILALCYEPGAAWNVTPIDQGHAMLKLLQSTPHILADTPELVGPLGRAVAGARCLMGFRPEAPAAAAEILRLINE